MNLKKLNQNMRGFSHLFVPLLVIVGVAVGGTCYIVISSADASGSVIDSGLSGKCLDNYYDRNKNGNKIDIYSCNSSAAQKWTISNKEIVGSTGKCIDTYQGKITLYTCSTANQAEQWVESNNTIESKSNSTDCIAVPHSSTTNNTQLILASCTSDNYMTWVVKSSGGGSEGGGGSGTGTTKYAPANGKTYIGVQSTSGEVGSFDSTLGISQPAIIGQYTSGDGQISGVISSDTSASSSAAPLVNWNVIMSNGQITSGSQDSYLKSQAATVKSYGKPIFIRLDWEMNDNWSPNYDPAGGTTPVSYVASWQHIYNIFQASGATNAAFVWCPNGGDEAGTGLPSSSAWYPGDAYVDWVCVDDYPGFTTESELLTGPDQLDAMANFAAAHNKPLMLGEWGPNTTSAYDDTASTYDEIFGWAASYPNTVKALMYFNFDNSTPMTDGDFLLADHPVGAAEFKKLITGNSRYIYSVQD